MKTLAALFLFIALGCEKQPEYSSYEPEQLYTTNRGQMVNMAYLKQNCIVDSSSAYWIIIDTSGWGEMARAMNERERLTLGILYAKEDRESEKIIRLAKETKAAILIR